MIITGPPWSTLVTKPGGGSLYEAGTFAIIPSILKTKLSILSVNLHFLQISIYFFLIFYGFSMDLKMINKEIETSSPEEKSE